MQKIESVKLKNSNGKTVYMNVLDKKCNDILIVVHGFDSSKNGSFIEFLRENLNVSIVSFDLPMHGESNDELLLSNCILNLETVESYVRNRFFNCSVSLVGSSFGCFVILNYLKKYPDIVYKNIFLKSAAVKMDKVFREVLIEEDMNSFKERGYTVKHRNKKMVIPYSFYEELVSNKICASDFRDREFYLFHGVNDDTALFDDLIELDSSNFHIIKFCDSHSFDDTNMSNIVTKIQKILR